MFELEITPAGVEDVPDNTAQQLEQMQAAAAAQGYTLRAARTGYVLQRGVQSWHSSDLRTLGMILRHEEVQ